MRKNIWKKKTLSLDAASLTFIYTHNWIHKLILWLPYYLFHLFYQWIIGFERKEKKSTAKRCVILNNIFRILTKNYPRKSYKKSRTSANILGHILLYRLYFSNQLAEKHSAPIICWSCILCGGIFLAPGWSSYSAVKCLIISIRFFNCFIFIILKAHHF